MRLTSGRRGALSLLGLTAAAALALSGCAADNGTDSGDASTGESTDAITIGISQFVQHPALDSATEGFKQAIADAGYVEGDTVIYDEQNANAEIANTTTIAQSLDSAGVDLVLAVATPSAMAAAQNILEIPVLFTAVTDAVSADIVASNEEPGANVTGTSDLNPVADQIAFLQETVPSVESIGIVYSSGEANSAVQVELAKEAADELGLEIVEATIASNQDITTATQSLVGNVDAIFVPTDNVVVEGIAGLVAVAEAEQIPVIAAEAGTVEGGAAAALGLDYFELGYQTGLMALEILENGADPATMAVQTTDEVSVIINPAAAERMGLELPASVVDRAEQVVE